MGSHLETLCTVNSNSATFAGSVSANQLIVVTFACSENPSAIRVTDNIGTVYQFMTSITGIPLNMITFAGKSVLSGTCTVRVSGTFTNKCLAISRYSGYSLPLIDSALGSSPHGSELDHITGCLVDQDHSLFHAVCAALQSGNVYTPWAGFTLGGQVNGNNSIASEYKLDTPKTTISGMDVGFGVTGSFSDATFLFTVFPTTAPPVPNIACGNVPIGSVGTLYSFQVPVTLSNFLDVVSITDGALPPGLSLSSTGLISGVPILPGTFAYVITLTHPDGSIESRQCVITINSGQGIGIGNTLGIDQKQ